MASMWQAVAGSPIGDELLEWPPDVFALTDVILERAEAYRFVLSPPDGVVWPPGGDVGEGITIVSLVCEDLAQNDDVAEVIRSVGPTIVSTHLLDRPQLTSRWSARYASVLADDPGSAS